MKFKWNITVIALLIIVFSSLLVGCGSSSEPPAKTPSSPSSSTTSIKLIEPCDLISKTEAQQYIGQPIKDPEKKETAAVGLKLCVYNTVAEGSGKLLQIGLTQQAFMPNNGQTPKKIYDAMKDNFKNAVKVEGIGTDAFIAPPGLHVLTDNYYLTFAVGNANDTKNQDLLKSISKNVVGKL